jgi:plastocyanin
VENQCVFLGGAVCSEDLGVIHTFSTTFVDDGFTMDFADGGSWVTANYEAALNIPVPIPQEYQPKTIEVEIGSNYFSPAHITINQGDTVTWTVVSGMHDVKSGNYFNPTNDFGSPIMETGGVYSHTFNNAGTLDYYWSLHPATMQGTVKVTAPYEAKVFGPNVDASNANQVHVQWFNNLPGGGTPGDRAEVWVSGDGGTSWHTAWSYDAGGPAAPKFVSVDVSGPLAGKSAARIQFIWLGQANSDGAFWTIDDFVMGGGAPPEEQANLSNPGAINGGDNFTDTFAVTDTSPVGDSIYFSLKNAPDFASLIPTVANPPIFPSTLAVNPESGDAGSYAFYVMATDAMNLRWVQEVTVSVFNSLGTTHFVEAKEVAFSPESLTINAGDTVTWNWVDGVHEIAADDGSFGAPISEASPQYSYTFNTPGTYSYSCDFHKDVGGVGTIIVQ